MLTRENPPLGRWNSIMVIRRLQVVRYKMFLFIRRHSALMMIDGVLTGSDHTIALAFTHSPCQIRQSECQKFLPVVGRKPGNATRLTQTRNVTGEEGQELFNHGYRRNGQEHVVGRVKLDENIWKVLTCWTFSLVFCGNNTRTIRHSGALWMGTLEICLAKPSGICITWICRTFITGSF